MTTVIAILVAAVLAYPVIAGRVFRWMGAPATCRGEGRDYKTPRLGCDGPWDIIWATHSCADCQAYHRAKVGAWLWIFWPIRVLPHKLFNAGADTTATPKQPTPHLTSRVENQ